MIIIDVSVQMYDLSYIDINVAICKIFYNLSQAYLLIKSIKRTVTIAKRANKVKSFIFMSV